MLRLRLTRERHALEKNIPPAQSTTGVANTNSTHFEALLGIHFSIPSPGIKCPIARKSTGTVNTRPIQNFRDRDVISACSALSSAPTVFGSSRMPQIGQSPEWSARFRDVLGTCRSSSAERPPLAQEPCRTLGNRQARRRRFQDASGTCICPRALPLPCRRLHANACAGWCRRHDCGGNARNGSGSSSF